MKKILILLILSAGFCFGQEVVTNSVGKKIALNNDYTWNYADESNSIIKEEFFQSANNNVVSGIFNIIKIPVKNGEDKNTDVFFEFLSKSDEFSQISVEKIQKIIDYSRDYLLLGLKNKYSFMPRKVKISYSDSKKAWLIIWEYTAKNSYGGEVAGEKLLLYNNDLERVEI